MGTVDKFTDLSFRVRNGLLNAGCPFKTKMEIRRWLIDYGPNKLLKLPNFGRSSFMELFSWLDEDESDDQIHLTHASGKEAETKYHEERIKYHRKMIEIHQMWFTHLKEDKL